MIFPISEIAVTVTIIIVPFLVGYSLFTSINKLAPKTKIDVKYSVVDFNTGAEKVLRKRNLTFIFFSLVLVEIAIAGYIPLISMATGRTVSPIRIWDSIIAWFCSLHLVVFGCI